MATKGMTPEERKKLLGTTPSKGTTEGTDAKSAEKNLRQEYENIRADEKERKARENYEKSLGMKKGGKVKKYADGGMTQQPTYPFYGNQQSAATTSPGVNQTVNFDNAQPPSGNPFQLNQPRPQGMKKGGMAKSSASRRGDGIAQRGKTKGRVI